MPSDQHTAEPFRAMPGIMLETAGRALHQPGWLHFTHGALVVRPWSCP